MSNTNTEPKRPTHNIWRVTGDNKDARWVKVGAAWPNRDGKGLNLVFDAVPVTGRIVLRRITAKAPAQKGGE
jgi:hypothetical protein